ncbi:ferrochelatase [Nocardiopsis sp. NRRL B-16309]|uniref:ferrochelatase n=1 Tax=Nocardiopsis sp. NRRL B-16309 TaxID=1519494 RepID=UPI0006AFE4D2|nr:ferrochelatase [Nocardiopsis sp. NRRL B-16309]KOX10209.1 ferrochelatase [Nocardiopsis sp. NRRL B-16309]
MRPYDAFLLISFGGPEGEDEVIPFLENVTRGRNIPRERLAEVGEHYFRFGGVSPINQQCRDLIAAITADFAENGIDLPVYWGNRFWAPMLTDTLARMREDGVRRVLAVPTSAYCNWSSRTAYVEDIARARAALGEDAPEVDLVRPFYDHPGFVEPLVEHTRAALDALPADQREGVRLLFSAHSIPTAMAEASGGPEQGFGAQGAYGGQLAEVARLVVDRLDRDHPYELVYQSRSGPPSQPWLEPDVNDRIEELAAEGVPAVVVVPHGFVSDHMEVKFDLDVEARETAEKLGLGYQRALSPGTHPAFVSMVSDLVREYTGRSERRRLGELPRCAECTCDR